MDAGPGDDEDVGPQRPGGTEGAIGAGGLGSAGGLGAGGAGGRGWAAMSCVSALSCLTGTLELSQSTTASRERATAIRDVTLTLIL